MYEMKNVARIVAMNGGLDKLADRPIKIEMDGFDRLCIEHVGRGPNGRPLVSVAHYFLQNGDLMSDPEMTFEVIPDDDSKLGWKSGTWFPTSITQSPTGVYREAVWTEGGQVLVRPRLVQELKGFARMWDRNIGAQGFVDAAKQQFSTVSARQTIDSGGRTSLPFLPTP